MDKRVKKPELIAPAGDLEKMKTAFAFGADAVYAGIPEFSLRARINDFNLESLKEAIKYAHERNKKIYITINIFAHNKHIDKLPGYIKKFKKIKPDGLIVSDPGAVRIIKKIWPKAIIHLSTQANCTNWQAAEFWFSQEIKRVILGREVTLNEIKQIRKKVPKLELETFIHGAMCMAYSGRCFLSKFLVGRSANLGDCIQACRWRFRQMAVDNNANSRKFFIKPEGLGEALELVEEEHGSYILNSEDLCLIKRVPELIRAGVSAFKIEGRAKSVYYLACVVGAYRRAIDTAHENIKTLKYRNKELDFLFKELNDKLYHRGYTEGFMFGKGKMAQNLDNSHKVPGWEFCGVVYNANAANCMPRSISGPRITNNANNIYIKAHNTLRVGDDIEIIMPGYDIIKMRLKKMMDGETGEELKEAHGGQGRTVVIECNRDAPEFSVLRRKIA